MSAEAGPSKSPRQGSARPAVQALFEDDQPESDVFAQLAADESDGPDSSAPTGGIQLIDDQEETSPATTSVHDEEKKRKQLEPVPQIESEEDPRVSGSVGHDINQPDVFGHVENPETSGQPEREENQGSGLSDTFDRLRLEEPLPLPAQSGPAADLVDKREAADISSEEAKDLLEDSAHAQPEDDIFSQLTQNGDSNAKEEEDIAEPELEAEPTPAPALNKPQQNDTNLEDLFAGGPSDDPFAEIGNPNPDEISPAVGKQHPSPAPILDAFKDDAAGSGQDVFAALAQDDPPSQVGEAKHERDFSDLLAEFEDDDMEFAGSETVGQSDTRILDPPSQPSAQHLFDDGMESSSFDDVLGQVDAEPTPPNQAASAPAIPAAAAPSTTGQDEDGNAPIPFDIPLGWYDDAGNWNWYTEDEKEQVRLAMLEQSGVNQDNAEASNIPIYSPALGVAAGQSENAARRTPQPDVSAARLESTSYDPYAPQPSLSQPVTISPYAPATPSSYSNSSYTYGSQPASAASVPTTATYDPYAPSSHAGSSHAPYGIAVPSYRGPSSAPSTAARAPAPAAERPAPPKRVVSNAYDPPLRPQKSFVRPASALSSTPTSMTPAPPVPVASLPQLSSPAPPPTGPPRRPKTPSAPSYAAPPSRVAPPTEQYQRQDDVPPVPPLPQQVSYAPPTDPYAMRPDQSTTTSPPAQYKPPPRNQSYNSFDPPLRPSSAARARAAGPDRAITPPISTLAPPPVTAPPPSGPPRGPSRGLMKKPSQIFETKPSFDARPPSRGPSAIVRTHSPLVPAAEIPSRPQSRSANERTEPSGLVPLTLSSREEYDPEGGMDEEGEVTPPISTGREIKQDVLAQEAQTGDFDPATDERVLTQGYEAMSYQHQGSISTHPSRGSSYAASLRDPYKSPPPANQRYMQTPARETEATSSYDPSPYRPQAQETSYGPAQHQTPQKDAHGPESYGLGLKTTGSPPPPSNVYNPYAPVTNGPAQDSYAPQASTSSASSMTEYERQSRSYNPYAPASQVPFLHPDDGQPQRTLSPSYSSDYGISPPQPSYFQNMHAPPADTTYVPQQVLEQKPISEDPLGRSTLTARNTPLAVFGFGGVLITAFPAQADSDRSMGHQRTPSYGYASGRGQLWIRTVSDLASTSALKPNDNVFPGPLVLDPSTPKGAAGDKKKREAITAYLQARAEEIEKGLPYLKSSANAARREEEGKLVIVKILSAMILGDGKLSGKTEVEDALCDAFSLSSSSMGQNPPNLSSAAGNAQPGYSSDQHVSSRANPSNISELGQMLSRGEKREAAHYAAKRGLWAHALLISSSVDPELWSETVLKFAEAELQASPDGAALRAAYAVFSGRTATSVEELVRSANLSGDPSQDRWREVISAVVFSGKPTDLACLDELGTRFRQAGLNYPAHVCHLLAPTSPFSDLTPPAIDRPIPLLQNPRDDDAIVFAELAEYARSLVVLPKGQESPVTGLPQLLPYKLQRAWLAAELGEVEQAKRYCTAIEAASKVGKNGPSVMPPALLASLEDLNERLTGTPSANPARLIGGQKTSKAGLGSWIEGRLSKFIAGEEDGSAPVKPIASANKSDVAGPFSHFSTISPAASGAVTRTASTVEFSGALNSAQNSPYGVPSRLSETQQYGTAGDNYGSGYNAWSGGQEVPEENERQDEIVGEGEAEFINPMAAFSVGGTRDVGPSDYQPKSPSAQVEADDDDEDLGFGNTSLSRGRTPRPAVSDTKEDKKGETKAAPVDEKKPEPAAASPSKGEAKGGWLKGWWGKKEGEGSGPIKAKLGEESSMIYDKDLKRWVVKGAKPEPVTAAPPPPPRAQTASPSHAARPESSAPRAMSATPPPTQAARNGPPPPSGPLARSSTAPMGFTEMPDGQIKRQKSSLAESITADEASSVAAPNMSMTPSSGPPAGGPPMGGPPKPPSRAATASIDDLLSRPPSKRPGSAAKKSMRNKYVDVLQPGS